MKFTAAVFLGVALFHVALAAPIAETSELDRRTAPGGGNYVGTNDITDKTDEEAHELVRRTAPGGGNYVGTLDIVDSTNETTGPPGFGLTPSSELSRRTSPGGGNYIGYHDIVDGA